VKVCLACNLSLLLPPSDIIGLGNHESGESDQGNQYRCRVSDASGAYKYSSYATLVVKEPLAIISSPKRQTVEAGEKARFTVQATGEDLTYQWYYRKPGTTDWTKSTAGSADEATLSVTAKNYLNGYQYRCKVTDDGGNYKYSSYATLVIEK